MPPRKLKLGAEFDEAEVAARYTAAAVSGGRLMPGSRKTTMWEKDRGGRLNVKEVSEGELVGIVIIGQPVGMMPKSWGTAIAE
jgi:hypothetical protein